MSSLRLVVDQNIPQAAAAFAQFGEVVSLPGRSLTREDLRGADALVVRSVTKVNSALLEGSSVRFVGTATIGTDHLDLPYLAQAGIPWASAAGCNARSVVEWVFTAIAEWSVLRRREWRGLTLGLVGHGNIGTPLAAAARSVGMRVLVNDPPKFLAGVLPHHTPLPELLDQADIVTCHVPLIRSGEDRTVHLLAPELLRRLKPGALLLNASRGEVIPMEALAALPQDMMLDVFENEPRPERSVVQRTLLATPHIAGYSLEGKLNGTSMMADAVARHLGTTSSWRPTLPPVDQPLCTIETVDPLEALLLAFRHSYLIRRDDESLRAGLELPDAAWGDHFDALRKNYPVRREFANYRVAGAPAGAVETLRALGFGLA